MSFTPTSTILTILRRGALAGAVLLASGCAGLNADLNIKPDYIPNSVEDLANQMESAVSIAEIGFSLYELAQNARGVDPALTAEQKQKFSQAIEVINLCIESIRGIDEDLELKL